MDTVRIVFVVAMAENGVIGRHGQLPWRLPSDLKRFRQLTLGKPMIMGRKTYESIGRPLPGRTTIVVTGQPDWSAEGVQVAASFGQALDKALALDPDVFVVGGAQIYAEALGHGVVDRLVVTHIDAAPAGDTYFPDLNWSEWKVTEQEPHMGDPSFTIKTYRH